MNRYYILITIMVVILTGCFDPPEFPVEPKIKYNKISFVDKDGFDSLKLTFDFEDGDGDIGLSSTDTAPPYHPFDYIFDAEFEPVTFSGGDLTLPLYRAPNPGGPYTKFSDEDIRPGYNCINYKDTTLTYRLGDSLVSLKDTVYVEPNEFNNNIHINLFRKIRGEYININNDFALDPRCPGSFDARFPIFDRNNEGQAISGTITYTLISLGFPSIFQRDSIMIEFYIYDQRLNKSNVVRTPDFVLPDITEQ